MRRSSSACERFYREVLGLPVVRRGAGADGRERSVWLGLGGGSFLALERAGGAPEVRALGATRAPASTWWPSGSRRASGRPWEARLAAAGVEVVHRTRWTLYVRDPEGNRIGLSHHPEDAP